MKNFIRNLSFIFIMALSLSGKLFAQPRTSAQPINLCGGTGCVTCIQLVQDCDNLTATAIGTFPAGTTFTWRVQVVTVHPTTSTSPVPGVDGQTTTNPVLTIPLTMLPALLEGGCFGCTIQYFLIEVSTPCGQTSGFLFRTTPVPVPPSVNPVSAICGSGSRTITVSPTVAGLVYNWYDVSTGGTPLQTGTSPNFTTPVLTSTTKYWVEAVNPALNCGPRTEVTVTVNPLPNAPAAPPVSVCPNDPAILSVNAVQGETYNWYDNAGTFKASGSTYIAGTLSATTDYFVESVSAQGCTSATRTQVTATLAAVCCPTSASDFIVTYNPTYVNSGGVHTFTVRVTNTRNFSISGVNVDLLFPSSIFTGATHSGPLPIAANSTAIFTFTGMFIPTSGSSTEKVRVTVPACNFDEQYTGDIFYGRDPGISIGAGACVTAFRLSYGCNSFTVCAVPPIALPAGTIYTWKIGIFTGFPQPSSHTSLLFITNSGPCVTVLYNSLPALGPTQSYWVDLDIMPPPNNGICGVSTDIPTGPFNPVLPTITASATSSTCSGTPVILTATSSSAGPFTWRDASGVIGMGRSITVNPTVTTTYTVSLDDNNATCGTADVTVTVSPCCVAPTVNAPTPTCASANDQYTLTVTSPLNPGDVYNIYDAGGTFVTSATDVNPTATVTTLTTATYYVETVNGTCTSARTPVTVTILNPVVTLTGLSFVYANGIVDYQLTITNPSANQRTVTLPPAPYSNRADFTVLVPPSVSTINLAPGASQTVTYRGFFTTAGVPAGDICFTVTDDNSCNTEGCVNVTGVGAGCPFSYSAVQSDCDQSYPQTKAIHLACHNNFFDANQVDFNFTYDPAALSVGTLQLPAGVPSGTTITSNSITNSNGTITVSGSVLYGSKVDILNSNGDGDVIVLSIIDFNVDILSNPSLSSPPVCELQMSTAGTTVHTTVISNPRPTDPVRILFQCAACPLVPAFFTATPNPAMQNEVVTFAANPSDGSHSWESGANNNQQIAKTTSTVTYKYPVPGDYVVTHYRTVNGVTGVHQETVTVCGITTGTVLPYASLCAGNAVSVPFTASACAGYTAGNVFTAQLSDANGSFVNAVNIGTLSGTTSGTIQGIIPAGTVTGTGYRVRVVSSSPAMNGTSNAGYTLSVADNCNTLSFNGLILDGSDDRVSIPHHSSYDIGGGDFTIETWVKLGSGNNGKPLVSNRLVKQNPGKGNGKGNQKTNIDGFSLSAYSDHLVFQANGTDYSSGSFAGILDNTCHHVAVTRSAGVLTFYVDGQAQGTVIGGKSISSSGTVYIGHDAIDNTYAKGNFNELRLWNVARSAAEISSGNVSVPAASSGLTGYWQFNESSGQTVIDASNASNSGYLGTGSLADAADPLRSTESCSPGATLPSLRMGSSDKNTSAYNVQIYPNPFTQGTTLYFAGEEDKLVYVKITSLSGVIIFEGELGTNRENQIGEQFPIGMYLLHIKAGESPSTRKLIKIE
jgi:hypothetical protein